MKKKLIIPIVVLLLFVTGAFIGWLIYDAQNDRIPTEYADINAMITSNENTVFSFLDKEDVLPENIKGYIIDPEKDVTDNVSAVFEKVDAISPNTVLVKHSDDKLQEIISAANENNLDVILLLPEKMLSEKDVISVYEKYAVKMICAETQDVGKAEKLYPALKEKGVVFGVFVGENITDAIRQSVENSVLDFYFVRIDSLSSGNGENVVKSWAEMGLKSGSKVYGVLRNDNVTQETPKEIYNMLRFTYNYGGFSGCIMYDREKLSTDDNHTTTNLYSYYEYFNNIDYTALTLTDVQISDDKRTVSFSGTSDNTCPVFVWCTASGAWSVAVNSDESGNFSVKIPLVTGKNKIVVKHKNAICTNYIDLAADVMTSNSAVVSDGKVILSATALKEASVYAAVANTYLVSLTKVSENGEYAQFSAEYELSEEMSLLTGEQVSFAATYNGLDDIVMCGRQTNVSPYNDNGLGRSDVCLVTKNYAETTSTAADDDSSDPTCTPQAAGSYGTVSSYVVRDNHVICVTDTGMKIHADDTRLILNGYTMPKNSINLDSLSAQNGTTLVFTPVYPTFVKLVAGPQDYYTGYLQRVYNVKEFNAEYIDILFMNTAQCSYTQEPDFSDSLIFSSAQWYTNTETDTITLRLYLREKGSFNGYSYSVDENGRIIIEFKNDTQSLIGTTVMLDPGHGGYGSPGTNYNMEVYEEDVTFAVTSQVAQILREHGATVIVTRNDNEALTLAQRVKMARDTKPDMFVSIHCDGADETSWLGTHTFYYKNYSMPLADSIHNQLVSAWRNYYYTDSASSEYTTLDRGIKFYPFMVTRIEECPSVLVECGYMTNEKDARFLISDGGQQIIATAIAQGIVDYIVNY